MNHATHGPSASRAKPLPHDDVSEQIAAILQKRGIVTSEQLMYALRIHTKLQGDCTLIRVLRMLGYLSLGQSQDRFADGHQGRCDERLFSIENEAGMARGGECGYSR